MRSLRSRLILGSALVAVVPLAIAMVVLARRVESTVRAEAGARLDATLGTLREQLRSDRERLDARLRLLALDPQLRRLYLVPSGRAELSEYLTERRFLLGLDFLQVADADGRVVADAAAADEPPARRVEIAAGAPIRYEGADVGALRGGLAIDSTFLARLQQTGGLELTLRDAGGALVASTLAAGASPPEAYSLSRSVPLELGPPPHPTLTAIASTAAADRTVAALRATSILLGLFGLLLAVLLGLLWSLQISRPVERLAAFSQRIARGELDEPLELESVRELETLVAALERMRADLSTYRERLITSERQAAWSEMARQVAHEIKNPLTPIAVSIADLRRSYELKRPEFPQVLDQAVRTVTAEVETMKRLLQEFSEFGRFPAPKPLPCRLADLVGELATLHGRDVEAGRLVFRAAPDVTFTADAGQMRQALGNLIRNGLDAVDGRGRVEVGAAVANGSIELDVADNGPGLDPDQRARLFVPGYTTKTHGSGLGLTIVERIVSDHGGTIAVDSAPARGTTFRIRLPLRGA